MRYMAIMYYPESGFSLFETAMRTTEDMAELVKHTSRTCAWGKVFTEDDGHIVAEWEAHNVKLSGARRASDLNDGLGITLK